MPPQAAREDVDVTALIKNILDNYPAGSATLREVLQNSDDAKSRKQRFILDTRSFATNALVDPALSTCQGPAIIACNDTFFEEKDWKSILNIHASSKTKDEASTGKYGLGFRSCYHITDNPHILSGNKLLILDAHRRVAEPFQGGFRIETDNNDRQQYADHFAPFASVFHDNSPRYEGTAIRYPLRMEVYAASSRIKNTPTTLALGRQMFHDFITKELAEVLLFLRHLTEIKLEEVADDGVTRVLGRAWIEDADHLYEQRSKLRSREEESTHLRLTIHVEVEGIRTSRHWLIGYFVEDYANASQLLSIRLGGRNIDGAMADDKLTGAVALALPLPDHGSSAVPFSGRLFTLLPLPIHTSFPLHINGVFALTSSRQNLRNAEDAIAGSREELLIEWNRLIFTNFVPKAWAKILSYFVAIPQSPNVFDVWPVVVGSPEGDRGYWHPLPASLLELAGDLAVWPVLSGKEASAQRHEALSDVLVAHGMDKGLIAALRACNVPILSPPSPIYYLIQASSKYSSRIASPSMVHPYLQKACPAIGRLEASDVRLILEYLITAKDLNLLYNLPLIPRVTGGHASITKGQGTYTLATEVEGRLFSPSDDGLLALWQLSVPTQKLLLSSARFHLIRPEDVVRYLRPYGYSRGSKNVNVSAGVKAQDVKRLAEVWNWMSSWDGAEKLFQDGKLVEELEELHAVPLDVADGRYELRRGAGRVLDLSGASRELSSALNALRLPILHSEIRLGGPARLRFVKTTSDALWILDVLPSQAWTALDLDQGQRKILHDHLKRTLSNIGSLSSIQQGTLRQLPIFPHLPSGVRVPGNHHFDLLPAASVFVDESVRVIPTIRGQPLVEHGESRTLAAALGMHSAAGEIAVLEMTVHASNWSQQAHVPGLSDLLVERIVRRLNDLSQVGRAKVSELAIIPVGVDTAGRNVLKSPSQVVDPKSRIASLYDPEDAVTPIGEWASDTPGSYIQQLRMYGMLRTQLSDSALGERIIRIGSATDPLRNRETKALSLLELLDEVVAGNQLSVSVVNTLRTQAWLPAGGRFCCPSECWDNRTKDARLCDLVLPIVPKFLRTEPAREALGWVTLPFERLRDQFLAVVQHRPSNPRPPNRTDASYLLPLLQELASRLASGSALQSQLKELSGVLGDLKWVPVTSETCLEVGRTMLDQVNLSMRFKRVHPSLAADMQTRSLLEVMGVSTRPTAQALTAELHQIAVELDGVANDYDRKLSLLNASVSILQELCSRPDWSADDHTHVLVPTENYTLESFDRVLFNNLPYGASSLPPNTHLSHQSISSSLATTLGLRLLSDENFAQDDDDVFTFTMAEDLTVRIQNVLKDYDIDYSSNEWVANAEDAKASHVKIIIDEALFKGQRVVGPSFSDFVNCPALIVYNDGVFSEHDFKGLGNVGMGGKRGSPEAIGRFGLGALAFWHFGERLMLVSAGSVLFLDPSQKYLPKTRDRASRSGMIMSIDACRTRFPDQLKPLEGLLGFTSSTSYYEGTLFHLPLRTVDQAHDSKLSNNSFSAIKISDVVRRFYDNASQSLFFTKLESISAIRRGPDMVLADLWAVSATRQSLEGPEHLGDNSELTLSLLEPSRGSRREEKWLVTTSCARADEFPEAIRPAFTIYRLHHPNFALALKIVSSTADISSSARLFATLPLPISTSMPVHIHASFVSSNDRRVIRFDAADSEGRRPLDSEYNDYLFQNHIPSLYLRMLEVVATHYKGQLLHSWPTAEPTDRISRAIFNALYQQFLTTSYRVLRTTTRKPIAPSQALLHVNRSAAVRRLLEGLRIPEYVVKLPFLASTLERSGLRVDSPEQVAQILRGTTPAQIKRILSETSANSDDVDALLQFLLKGKQSLLRIPLLSLADGDVITFRGSEQPKTFTTSKSSISALFGRSKVPSTSITSLTLDLLNKEQDINVRPLDENGMRELLRLSDHAIVPATQMPIEATQVDWYTRVLRFLVTNPTVKLEHLANLPLIPTLDARLALSLDYALDESVWWSSGLFYDAPFLPILRGLGIPTINPNTHARPGSPNNLARALRMLRFLNGDLHHRFPRDQWRAFANWLKGLLGSTTLSQLKHVDRQTLISLPLFPAQQGTSEPEFHPSTDILMLPPGVSHEFLARYLPESTKFSPFSRELELLYAHLRTGQRGLTVHNLIDCLSLPDQLDQEEDDGYRHVLDIVVTYHSGLFDRPLIPDGNRILRIPSQLYDHRVELFRICLANRPQLFVHPDFQQSINKLIQIGVVTEQTLQATHVVTCASAVDRDTRDGVDTRQRAGWFWRYLPDSTVLRSLSFESIQHLRFIPSNPSRHLNDPTLATFAHHFPEVVAPSEACLAEHLPILWTQRTAFAHPPPAFLKAVHPRLGEPTVKEVVLHLVALATRVAPERSGNGALLVDIKRTYDWLQTHVDVAGPLLIALRHQPLWLNVEDDALHATWVWRPAEQLVHDLRFDQEGSFYDVRSFLDPYKKLLRASGALEHVYPELPADADDTPTRPHHIVVCDGLNQLLKDGLLLDIGFRIDDGEVIKAHRVALAAAIPHFRDAFSSGFQDTIPSSEGDDTGVGLYPFPPEMPSFAIRSVLEFVYTGSFVPPPAESTEEAGTALEKLLRLLKLSDMWGVDVLKNQVQRTIVSLKLVRPETCDSIEAHALQCEAAGLVKVCQESKSRNSWAM